MFTCSSFSRAPPELVDTLWQAFLCSGAGNVQAEFSLGGLHNTFELDWHGNKHHMQICRSIIVSVWCIQ